MRTTQTSPAAPPVTPQVLRFLRDLRARPCARAVFASYPDPASARRLALQAAALGFVQIYEDERGLEGVRLISGGQAYLDRTRQGGGDG